MFEMISIARAQERPLMSISVYILETPNGWSPEEVKSLSSVVKCWFSTYGVIECWAGNQTSRFLITGVIVLSEAQSLSVYGYGEENKNWPSSRIELMDGDLVDSVVFLSLQWGFGGGGRQASQAGMERIRALSHVDFH